MNSLDPNGSRRRSPDPVERPPWTSQGEVALRSFMAQMQSLPESPDFLRVVLQSLIVAGELEPAGTDLRKLFESSDFVNRGFRVTRWVEGPYRGSDQVPALTRGQYLLETIASSGRGHAPNIWGEARIIFALEDATVVIKAAEIRWSEAI